MSDPTATGCAVGEPFSRARLAELIGRERDSYRERHPASAAAAGPTSRDGNVGAPVDPRSTPRVVEFNDIDALVRELAHHDVS